VAADKSIKPSDFRGGHRKDVFRYKGWKQVE